MDKTRLLGLRLLPLPLALLLLVPACASGPRPPPGPSAAELAGASAKTIIVSPFNVVNPLPPELEGTTKKVKLLLVDHLEANGKDVKVMGYRAARDLWKDSTREVRESGQKKNFDNAAKIYARKIREHLEFDAVIVPSLFLQNAKASGRTARWDGTEQKLEMEGRVPTNRANRYSGSMGTVYVQAASVFVRILDANGKTIHDKKSGIELIQHLELIVKDEGLASGAERVDMELVDDEIAIDDDERISMAVKNVLIPFVPKDPTESQPVPAVEPGG